MRRTTAFTVGRLGPDDAAAFRTVRLDGLARHPEAFGASWEVESEQPLAWFAATLEGQAVFGAWSWEGELIGVAALYVPEAPKLRHKGTLWGVFVSPDARGDGVGTALIAAVMAHAETCVDDVGLSVGAANSEAVRRYEAAGFMRYGLEPRVLRISDVFYDEVLMSLSLNRRG
ncbi:GNAT family N-acetyltransferase [Methylobacterium sp. J-090]|uniref:GNAT family N-acetyltransferase n=1 Tax=Methylobacterium sp. J-090 TaxID=2836666 RepID=UPI001FBC0E3B|nr:GNAT family N-acetyltransferase [Methylobacterium sp. J-090]MCJ2080123.1 GNAT family N-acetyltransferase [Methylobacterium sp. J-090]